MQKLKPCPFCGGYDVHVVDEITFSFIECYDCLAAFHQLEACSVEDNVEAWNRRPGETVHPGVHYGKKCDERDCMWIDWEGTTCRSPDPCRRHKSEVKTT